MSLSLLALWLLQLAPDSVLPCTLCRQLLTAPVILTVNPKFIMWLPRTQPLPPARVSVSLRPLILSCHLASLTLSRFCLCWEMSGGTRCQDAPRTYLNCMSFLCGSSSLTAVPVFPCSSSRDHCNPYQTEGNAHCTSE